MANIQTFLLPDLGEGLPDAEIVEWKVKVGDLIQLDAPLVAMETAKAIVDVPSPYSGKVLKLFGQAGDVIETGKALAEFELSDGPQRAQGHDTGHHGAHAPAPIAPVPKPNPSANESARDSGTVVGSVQVSDNVVTQAAIEVGGVKALPQVRAMAKKLGVDLRLVSATGPQGSVSLDDLKRYAAQAPARPEPAPAVSVARSAPESVAARAPAAGAEALRGVRRNMARTMSQAHAEVVPTTLMDDADIHTWQNGQDITVRLLRSIVRAAQAEPALNAWFDGKAGTRTLHKHVDIGIAVDTDEGLFVPALRNADVLDAAQLRLALNRLREQVKARAIPSADLSGYTITLSNFGVYAGRYATPIVVPPCVAIVAAGKLRYDAVPVMGGIAAHRMIPLSLTFDHRACTGGEAARFLKAMLDDLQRAN
jgi:pyruvate dehydrogenase E2 component (dihydrolipoamide acetyltransferase)